MKIRIKQIDQDIYIPQLKKNLFNSWLGIDNNWNELWYDKSFQTKYCGKKTYQEALNEIEFWKTKNHKKKRIIQNILKYKKETMNTPTAEEFLKRENLPTDILSGDDINYAMIEFAKLHVEAALKVASKKATTLRISEHLVVVNQDSVLFAYPLTLIK